MTSQITDLPMSWPECANDFIDNVGRIIFYNKWNRTQVVVAGYSAKDTRAATNIFTSEPINYSIGKMGNRNPELIINISDKLPTLKVCINYTITGNVSFENLYEDFDVIPIIRECPKKTHIDCMPIVSPANRKYCVSMNREWIQKNCNVFYTD